MTDITPQGLAARGLRVKALEWEDQPGGSYCWTQGLHYYTEGSDAEQDWYVSCMINNDDVWQGDNQSTREAAKAAAQADYESRILAALDATPEALTDLPAVRALVEAERERCAAVCEKIDNECGMEAGLAKACAAAIRQGETT